MNKTKNATKTLVLSALLVALSVVIGFLCKTYLTFGAIRITFENLPILLAAFAFGPLVGAAVGAASDVASCLASGFAVNPVITVGAASIGLCAGVLRRFVFKNDGYVALFLPTLISHAVGSMLIKSIGLYLLGYALPLLLPRVPLYIGISLAESYLIYIIYKNRRLAAVFNAKKV